LNKIEVKVHRIDIERVQYRNIKKVFLLYGVLTRLECISHLMSKNMSMILNHQHHDMYTIRCPMLQSVASIYQSGSYDDHWTNS